MKRALLLIVAVQAYGLKTRLAFDQALRLGCDGLELDLQLAKDDVLVVHHDTTLRADSTRRNGEWLPKLSTHKARRPDMQRIGKF